MNEVVMRDDGNAKIFDTLMQLLGTTENVFVYGAGKYGSLMVEFLEAMGISISGVVVSSKPKDDCRLKGYVVSFADDIVIEKSDNKTYTFVLAMRDAWQQEVSDRFKDVENIRLMRIPASFFREISGFLFYREESKNPNVTYHEWKKYFTEVIGSRCILVRREGGIGDLLTLEPLLRNLKKLGYTVLLETANHYLFKYNESVDCLFRWGGTPDFISSKCLVFNLNLSHEYYPYIHMLDGYHSCLKGLLDIPPIENRDRIPVYNPAIKCNPSEKIKKICINNEATGWKTRIYDLDKMRDFAEYLKARGYEIFEIGSNKHNFLGVGHECFGLKFEDTVKLMSEMDLYVGLDNGLMHVAQSIFLPVFLLFGCTCPNLRIHDWTRARVMWKNVDELPCAGCHHRRRIPCTKTECMYDNCYCLDWSVEEVIYAFEHLKYNDPPVLKQEMFTPLWPKD